MLGTLSMVRKIFAAALLAVVSASKYGAALAALKPPRSTHRKTVRRAPALKMLKSFGRGHTYIIKAKLCACIANNLKTMMRFSDLQ